MPAPLTEHELTVETTLKGELARTLLKAAKARAVQPVALLATIIETVLRDDLIDAVLDT